MSAMDAHLDDATWERLAMGELAPDERRVAGVHIVARDQCRTIHRGLHALEEIARDEGLIEPREIPPRPARVHRPLWRPIAAAASALAAAAVIAIVAWPRSPGTNHAVRGEGDRAVELLPIAAPCSPCEFAWKPVPGAARYRVEVFTAEGRVAWSAEVDGGSATWPARDAAPGAYQWRVEALDRDGVIAHSTIAPVVVPAGPRP